MKREPIYGLDLVRFVAACFVVCWHLGYRFFDPDANNIRRMVDGIPTTPQIFAEWTQWGWVGVQIFFVISGFVIAYSTPDTTPWKFFISRLARLWPGVALCATLIICINIGYWHVSPYSEAIKLFRSIIFYPSGPWIAPQYWTLPVEVAFYGLVWLFLLIKRVEWLDYLGTGILIASASYWSYVIFFGNHFRTDIANILLLNHGCYFAFGIALSTLCRRGHNGLAYFIIVGSILVAIPQMQYSLEKYGVTGTNQFRWLIPYCIWLGTVGVIYISMLWRARISAAVVRQPWLGRSLRAIGLATFPLYLIHIHIGGLVATLLVRGGHDPVVAVLMGGLSCVPLSLVIARFGEPPLRKLLVACLRKVERASAWIRPSIMGGSDLRHVQIPVESHPDRKRD